MLLFLTSPLLAATVPDPGETWQEMVDRIIPAIVTIKVSATRNFDTEGASNSIATGFVVDARRGLILTNRHVVQPGPVVAEAIFADHEEVPLYALYLDPIHDFGVYRFDPAEVRFQEVVEAELVPEHARVGTEIRVVGSDNAEKLAILSGTIARLDREAPRYGSNRFNDFNTFYLQAASSTSGGSSGSPVLDIHGHAIALNAGGARGAATSFFLPLDRVKQVLELLRAGQPVPRGTLRAVFEHATYDEVRRLGLRPETETRMRKLFPEENGLLVVAEVVPGGAATGRILPGDVLVEVNHTPLTRFAPLEDVLDGAVGTPIHLGLERGGVPIEVDLPVEDLAALTPASYLAFGGGVLHDVSFQQARNHSVSTRGVYVAAPGFSLETALVPAGSVISQVGDEMVGDLAAMAGLLGGLGDGARVPIRYHSLDDPRRDRVAVVTVDRRWFPTQWCTRDTKTGGWPCVDLPAPPPVPPGPVPEFSALSSPDPMARRLAPSLVWVRNVLPFRVDGVYATAFSGTGVVVDAEAGLVLVDRDTVPNNLGVVTLTFGGTAEVPAEIVAVHPFHNLALVRYDPRPLRGMPIRAAKLGIRAASVGSPVWHVGLLGAGEIQSRRTRVTRFEPLFVPLPNPPQFRDTNLQVYDVDTSARASGGVLVSSSGAVVAFVASFVDKSGDKPVSAFRGIPAEIVARFLAPLLTAKAPEWRVFGAELLNMGVPEAIQRGLAPATAQNMLAASPRRKLLEVQRRILGSAAADHLHDGDLILSVNGSWAPEVADVERAADAGPVEVRVFRPGDPVEKLVQVAPFVAGSDGPDRVVGWAGALIQPTPASFASQRGLAAAGLYVAWHWYGAPATRYGLVGTYRIVAIDDVPVPTLDAFLAAVGNRADRSAVRVRVLTLDGREDVVTLKLDLQYWPTFELRRTPEGWIRIPR